MWSGWKKVLEYTEGEISTNWNLDIMPEVVLKMFLINL